MEYNGVMEAVLTDEEIARVYEGNNDLGLIINQYLIIKSEEGKVLDKLRWDGKEFKKLLVTKIKDFKPKTPKQECLCDLLTNHDIPIKIVAGCAGSGKSKLCIVFGLHFLEKQKFGKFFVVRHNVSVGEKNGYLPGDKFEKIRGWLGFLEDNLDETQLTIEDMVTNGSLQVDGIEYMKGRDLKDSWILIDECEDLTEEQFKMVGERVSQGSIICFVGDYEQVTQDKFKKYSGIRRAIRNLAGLSQVGIVVFDDEENDNVRSMVSRVFTSKY